MVKILVYVIGDSLRDYLVPLAVDNVVVLCMAHGNKAFSEYMCPSVLKFH